MKKRLFFSIPLPRNVSDQLAKAIKQINGDQKQFDNIRWLSPENWHITLLFMGNVQDTLIPEILEEVQEAFRPFSPFPLKFKKIVFAPDSNNARMIWAEYEKNENHNALSQAVYKKLKRFILDDTANHPEDIIPHITLARLNKNNKSFLPSLAQPIINDIIVDTIDLMESKLVVGGSIYTKLYEFKISAL